MPNGSVPAPVVEKKPEAKPAANKAKSLAVSTLLSLACQFKRVLHPPYSWRSEVTRFARQICYRPCRTYRYTDRGFLPPALFTLQTGDGYNGGYGKYVVIKHANGTQTLYAHMSRVAAEESATVAQGEVIGYVGSTGRSTGLHVHFEVRGAKTQAQQKACGRDKIFLPTLHYYCLSDFGLYCRASKMCEVSTCSLSARSAMVRASFMMRWYARAESPSFSAVVFKSFFVSSERGTYLKGRGYSFLYLLLCRADAGGSVYFVHELWLRAFYLFGSFSFAFVCRKFFIFYFAYICPNVHAVYYRARYFALVSGKVICSTNAFFI